jgi:hypothetical protein
MAIDFQISRERHCLTLRFPGVALSCAKRIEESFSWLEVDSNLTGSKVAILDDIADAVAIACVSGCCCCSSYCIANTQ